MKCTENLCLSLRSHQSRIRPLIELRCAKQQDDQADGLFFDMIFSNIIFVYADVGHHIAKCQDLHDLGHHILVGGLEHFLFSMIYGIILPID